MLVLTLAFVSLQVRAKIEAHGRDARWEFDRTRLFGASNYMAGICDDLHNIAKVLQEFYNIFGQELKSVTGNPQLIEDVVKRVASMVDFLCTISFDPLDQVCGRGGCCCFFLRQCMFQMEKGGLRECVQLWVAAYVGQLLILSLPIGVGTCAFLPPWFDDRDRRMQKSGRKPWTPFMQR